MKISLTLLVVLSHLLWWYRLHLYHSDWQLEVKTFAINVNLHIRFNSEY